jgi:sugar lactone lactonase YvrE
MSQEPQNVNVDEVFYRNTPPNILSESPIYRASDSTLHWLDLLSQPSSNIYILPLDPTTSKPLGEARVLPVYLKRNGVDVWVKVTYIGFRKGNPGYICAYGQGIGYLDEESGMLDIIEQFIEDGDKEGWSMNDGGIDPQGRLWINEVDLVAMSPGGSFEGARGRLWRFDGERCTIMERGLTGGNGMGWSPCGRFSMFPSMKLWGGEEMLMRTVYVNDSGPNVLWRYDFDGETGEISNKTKIFDGLQGPKGILNDGMVVE